MHRIGFIGSKQWSQPSIDTNEPNGKTYSERREEAIDKAVRHAGTVMSETRRFDAYRDPDWQ